MGGCVNQSSKSIAQELKNLSTVPTDTNKLNPTELPQLKFSFILEEVKVRKCQHKEIALRFKIDGVDEHMTSYKKLDSNMRAVWRTSQKFESKMTEYDLRMRFLVIQAFNKHKQQLGSIKINLYLIWRGPVHINLPFLLEGSKQTRLSFNFKISQAVHILINTLQARMLPNIKKASGELYTFWIQPIINQQLQPAKYTYFLKIDDGANAITKARKYPDQQDHLELFTELGMKKVQTQKDISEMYTAPNDDIVWKEERATDLFLPQIDKIIYSNELRSTTLYLIFFHVIPEKEYNFEIDSSCYIYFSKLLDGQFKVIKDPQTKITYKQYKIDLAQKTWLHGREVGEVRVSFNVKVQNNEQQMLTCVRTENGIQAFTPVFTNFKTNQNKEIIQMKELHTAIQKDLVEVKCLNYEQSQSRDLLADVKKEISKMIKILSSSSKESVLIYEYNNQLDLVEAQTLLIDIASKAHAYIQQSLNPEIEALCWQILMLFLKRGEFTLINIGFKTEQMEDILNNKIDQILKAKISIGIQYCKLLNQLLETTLQMLVNQGQQTQTAFVEAFCSYAYFRIPVFREIIISSISRPSDPEIQEWRDISFNLKEEPKNRKGRQSEDYFTVLFNWDHSFYKCLNGQSDYKITQSKLRQIIQSESNWKDRLSRRRGAFFTFIENLIKEIEYVTVISQYIDWQYLPGYSRLLYAFLAQMKMMKVMQMTNRFKRCLLRMLSNEKLLNVFVVMLMKKTNIYDINSTMASLSILDDCFKKLKKTQRKIPTTFDYKFLLNGIKVVLDSDYEFNIEKALIILYNHFNFFVNEFSLELILFLMSKYFFKFFFHWSYSLRKIFHTLIYAKVHMLKVKEEEESMGHLKRMPKTNAKSSRIDVTKVAQSTPYNQHLKIFIIQRFQHLMTVIRQQILPDIINKEINIYVEHKLHNKMKHKLELKKVQQSTQPRYNIGKQKLEHRSPPTIRYASQTINKKMIVTRHKIYFRPQEMQVVHMESSQRTYVKQSVDQYKRLMESLQKKYLEDPNYEPELIAKKMKDQKEKDLEQVELDQW